MSDIALLCAYLFMVYDMLYRRQICLTLLLDLMMLFKSYNLYKEARDGNQS